LSNAVFVVDVGDERVGTAGTPRFEPPSAQTGGNGHPFRLQVSSSRDLVDCERRSPRPVAAPTECSAE